jgi:hypothetical protein
MNLHEAILNALDAAYELNQDEIYSAMLRLDWPEVDPSARDVVDAIEQLLAERWLYKSPHQKAGYSTFYRRRTANQVAALQAEATGAQPRLL